MTEVFNGKEKKNCKLWQCETCHLLKPYIRGTFWIIHVIWPNNNCKPFRKFIYDTIEGKSAWKFEGMSRQIYKSLEFNISLGGSNKGSDTEIVQNQSNSSEK